MGVLKINYVAVDYVYDPINKTIFKSTAIDSTFLLRSTSRQCHVIVGNYQGEGHPSAALFLPQNKAPQVF